MENFLELNNEEMLDIDGGVAITLTIGGICAAISTAYGLGYAIGQAIGYSKK